MAIFLEESELEGAYLAAKKASRQWFQPFAEYERIAANLPSASLPENYPQVTDGTLAALIAETPMRTWAQLQTGRVISLETGDDDFEPWKTEMVNVLWANKIVPNANAQAPFFSKLQTAQYRSLIYGSQPIYSFQVSHDNYTGADFVLPYIKDVKLEPGKVSDRDCDYIFLDTYYTKLQLKNIIDQAKKDKAGVSGWDWKALQSVYDSDIFGDKDPEDKATDEEKADTYSKTAHFVTVFHRGYKAPFYTFVPKADNDIVRTTYNTNRCGDLPITFIYNQLDLINPYGRGQIELAGPTQNMLDFLLAAFGLATQQGLEPNFKIKGDPATTGLQLDTIEFTPGQPWMMGNGDVEIVTNKNSVYDSFATNSGMFKTNIMNLQGTSDATVSGSAGNPQYSKTPAGVKYQQERTNAKDNFLRQRADEAVSQLAKNLINLYIGNMEGSEFVKITDEQRTKLEAAGKVVPEGDNEILIEFDELKNGEFAFDVDPNSSIVKNDDETQNRLVELTQTLLSIPSLPQTLATEGKQLKVGELIKDILSTSGVDNWERILVDATAGDQGGAMATGQDVIDGQGNLVPPAEVPVAQGEEVQPEQAPAPAVGEPEPTPPADDEAALTAHLQSENYTDEDIQLIHALRRNGWNSQQIAEYIEREKEVTV